MVISIFFCGKDSTSVYHIANGHIANLFWSYTLYTVSLATGNYKTIFGCEIHLCTTTFDIPSGRSLSLSKRDFLLIGKNSMLGGIQGKVFKSDGRWGGQFPSLIFLLLSPLFRGA
jgi:hypothetical protein